MRFTNDTRLAANSGVDAPVRDAISGALHELFGTPDEPRLPGAVDFLEVDRLRQAAGPVISHTPGVTQGLYRRHCARCHGVTGDGRGPTAYYQNPYPRDFRRGVFKWKSTRRDAPPTAADLAAVIEHGVPGTAMPSFRLLKDDERETLRQYVVYLSLRGQVERELVWYADEESGEVTPASLVEAADRFVDTIVASWASAASAVVNVSLPDASAEAIAVGRDLYHSDKAGCVKCHGPEGRGGVAPETDYDLWTADRVSLVSRAVDQDAAASDLPIRPSPAPALVGRTPRGGADREDLYRRLHQGVAGTPMPAVGPRRPGEAAALDAAEIAALTDYVRSIMHTEVGG